MKPHVLKRNRDAREFVSARAPFINKSKTMYGVWIDPINFPNPHYVVYSYGDHFPMYVWVESEKRWYGNSDRYSQTTTAHQSYARPRDGVAAYFTTDQLKAMIANRPAMQLVRTRVRFGLPAAISSPSPA